MISRLFACLFSLSIALAASADVVVLNSGHVESGKVLRNTGDEIFIQLDYGTISYPKSMVKEIKLDAGTQDQSASTNFLPGWTAVIANLVKESWSTSLKQIPATVIDEGILRHVPYLSFQCAGGQYELNIYGDPDKPDCIEIGVRQLAIHNDAAKSNCVSLASSWLRDENAKTVVQRLMWRGDSGRWNDWKLEITPPSAPDSYGGWWVSIYNEAALEKARASAEELTVVAQPVVKPSLTLPSSRIQTPAIPAWTTDDLKLRRTLTTPSPAIAPNMTGGRVYVRGYYRKDGTYVRPHTRRR